MDIVFYIYIFLASISVLFVIVGFIIENFVDESHSLMKWWRKHIIALDTEDSKPKDDIHK